MHVSMCAPRAENPPYALRSFWLLTASGGLYVWVMHAYVHSPHRKPAFLVNSQKFS